MTLLPFVVLHELGVGVYLALRNGPYCILRTTGVTVVQHTITVGAVLLHAGPGICKLTPAIEVGKTEILEGELYATLVAHDSTKLGLREALVLTLYITHLWHAYALAHLVDAVDGCSSVGTLLDKSLGIAEKHLGIADNVVVH